MDLGKLITTGLNVYGQVQQAKYTNRGATPVRAGTSPADWPWKGDMPGGGLPGYDVIEEPGECTDPRQMVYKYSPAKGGFVWQKKRRRRRKRLATMSDIRDLAALEGVLGKGKLLATWIATHS